MQTKSNIQLVKENLAIREMFKNNLEDLMNKYTVEDSYFASSKTSLGNWEECTKGYFVFEKEYNNFDNAISNMNNDSVIRIIDNKRFQIGKVYEKLSDAKGERVIDITTGAAAIGTDSND